jgi:hypothetical protein
VAFLGQGILFDTRPSFAVPFGIVACGSCTSLVLVSTLRMLFPTILNNPSKGLLLNKAHISKLEFIPLSWPIQEIRQKIGRVSFPFRGKTGVTCAIALLIGVSLWTMDGEVLTPRWAVRALIVVLVIIAIGLRG